jgi:hypothetical protein
MKQINFSDHIIREKITSRGGGVEISLDQLGFKGQKMTAYQNYLGGGMLGRIDGDCTVNDWRGNETLVDINEQIKQYYHEQTNPNGDIFESISYEQNQKMPSSAY